MCRNEEFIGQGRSRTEKSRDRPGVDTGNYQNAALTIKHAQGSQRKRRVLKGMGEGMLAEYFGGNGGGVKFARRACEKWTKEGKEKEETPSQRSSI